MDKYLRPGIAELVGTFFLTFIGAGSICVNTLVGEGGSGLVGVAIAHGLALAIGVTATMAISGGHLNPAVTITMWVYKKIDNDMALAYVIFQLLGAVIAGGLLCLLFTNQSAVVSAGHLGTPHLNAKLLGITEETNQFQIQAWGAAVETILTFLLVFVIFGTAVDSRAPKVGGFAIGLTIAADILVGGPLTGAAMNPARAFGPAIWEAGVMGNLSTMKDQLVYWIGPIVGGILAGGLYINCILPPEPQQAPAHSHAAPGKA
jgi:MIP family channel proteins